MKNNEMDKKRIKIEQSKPYDPLEIAKREGNIYGAGLIGKYKKNTITRVGFILIGGSCLLGGLIGIVVPIIKMLSPPALSRLGLVKFDNPLSRVDPVLEFISGYIYLLFCFVLFIMGIFIIKNALRRK